MANKRIPEIRWPKKVEEKYNEIGSLLDKVDDEMEELYHELNRIFRLTYNVIKD